MRKRFAVSAALLLVAASLCVAGYWLLQPHPRIDEQTRDRIEIGMTEREVIDIIGAPPGDYGLGKASLDFYSMISSPVDETMKSWYGQKQVIHVWFDRNGRATCIRLGTARRSYDSHFDMICQKLRLKEPRPTTFEWSFGIPY